MELEVHEDLLGNVLLHVEILPAEEYLIGGELLVIVAGDHVAALGHILVDVVQAVGGGGVADTHRGQRAAAVIPQSVGGANTVQHEGLGKGAAGNIAVSVHGNVHLQRVQAPDVDLIVGTGVERCLHDLGGHVQALLVVGHVVLDAVGQDLGDFLLGEALLGPIHPVHTLGVLAHLDGLAGVLALRDDTVDLDALGGRNVVGLLTVVGKGVVGGVFGSGYGDRQGRQEHNGGNQHRKNARDLFHNHSPYQLILFLSPDRERGNRGALRRGANYPFTL